MADKLGGDAKKKKAASAKKKAPPEVTIGHNLSKIQADGGAFVKRLDKLHDDKETQNAEYMSDIGHVYEDMADKLGVPRALCRQFFSTDRRARKAAAARAEMLESERDALETLEAAFGPDSGFGAWAKQKAADAKEAA